MNYTEDTIFNLTKRIIEDTEERIFNYSSRKVIDIPLINGILNLPKRYLLYPIKYLLLGAEDLFKPLLVWLIISFIFWIPFVLFIPNINNAPQGLLSFISNIVFIIPIFLVMFSVPSTYAFYGLTNKEIQKITDDLYSLGIYNNETIEYIQSNLDKIYERVVSKYNAYRWIIGSIWFLSVLFITISIRIGFKIPEVEWIKILQDSISSLSFLIFFTIFAIFIITSYKRASDILFKSIEFSLVELKYKLNIKEKSTKD